MPGLPFVRNHRRSPTVRRVWTRRGMGVLCNDGADDPVNNCSDDGGPVSTVPVGSDLSLPGGGLIVGQGPLTPQLPSSGSNSLTNLFSSLALGGESILAKIAAPPAYYSVTKDANGNTVYTAVAAGTPGAVPLNAGVLGSGSTMLWLGLGLGALLLIGAMMSKK